MAKTLQLIIFTVAHLIKGALLCLIIIYQKTLSPDHGLLRIFFPFGACKYRPTCSEYAYQAIQEFGILKGLFLGTRRLARCHPWSEGDRDPLGVHNNHL